MKRDGRSLLAALAVACCLTLPGLADTLVITEFMAVNRSTIADEDGEFCDWIEIHNATGAAARLDGWSLTDDAESLDKWTFPDVELGAGRFLVVFASSKDRRTPGGELHTSFKLRGAGEFLALVDPRGAIVQSFAPEFPAQSADASYGLAMESRTTVLAPAGAAGAFLVPRNERLARAWTGRDFDDGGWVRGATPVGFDQKRPPTFGDVIATDIGESMRRASASLYLRVPFAVDDPASVHALLLRIRYDDGFVAYVNGQEAARASAPGDLDWTSSATAARDDEEPLAHEVFDASSALGALEAGPNVLALHGLNTTSTNADFLLDPEVGAATVTRVDGSTLRYFETPTPGWPNPDGVSGTSAPPRFSRPGAAYPAPFTVELSAAGPAAEIRYTIDGSAPTRDAPLYTGGLSLARTTTIRARAFEPGRLPSPVVTESYVALGPDLTGFDSDLPLIVVDTFGESIRASWTPGHMLVVDRQADGRTSLAATPDFIGKAAFKIRGSSTAGREKASLGVEIQDQDGADRDVEILGFPADSDFILYGAYNFDRALMRNAFIYEVSRRMGRYAVRTRFVELFLNRGVEALSREDYFGVYSFCEKIKRGEERVDIERLPPDADSEPEITGGYMLKIDRLDPGDVGFRAGGQGLAYVDPKESEITPAQAAWIRTYIDELAASFLVPNPTDPGVGYPAHIDVGSWIDFHLLNEITRNPDGLSLSTYMFKPREGKLFMGPIWDYDRAMGADDDARATDPEGWSGSFRNSWYSHLVVEESFWSRYTDRWLELRQTHLSARDLHAILDGMAEELAEAQVRNFERWPLDLGEHGWRGKVDALKQWMLDRIAWIDTEFIDAPRFGHPGGRIDAGFELSITAREGDIYYTLDGHTDPRDRRTGDVAPGAVVYAGPIPLTRNTRVLARARVRGLWSALVRDTYTVETPPIRITELMYEPLPSEELTERNFEFIELQNIGASPLSLEGVMFDAGIPVGFAFEGDRDPLDPGEHIVIVKNLEAFATRTPIDGIRIAGEYSGSLRNTGEKVRLVGPLGETILDFEYDADWYPETRGGGHSLTIVDPRTPADRLGDASSWKPSREVNGTPGRADDAEADAGAQLPGDVNQDSRLNVTDAAVLLRHLFGEPLEPPCAGESVTRGGSRTLLDFDGDADVDLTDAIQLLNHLFRAGPAHVLGTSCAMIEGCDDVCRDR